MLDETHLRCKGVDLGTFKGEIDMAKWYADSRRGYIQSGGEFASLLIPTRKNFRTVAYAGPDIIKSGRAEHLPLHFHLRYDGFGYRIKLDDWTEYDGLTIPKHIRKVIKKSEAFRIYLELNTKSIFETGEMCTHEWPVFQKNFLIDR